MRLSLEMGPNGVELRLNEVICVGPKSNRTAVLIRGGRDTGEESACEDTVIRWPSTSQEERLAKNRICQHLDLGLASFQTERSKSLFHTQAVAI